MPRFKLFWGSSSIKFRGSTYLTGKYFKHICWAINISEYLHIPHPVYNMYMLPKHYAGDHDRDHPNSRKEKGKRAFQNQFINICRYPASIERYKQVCVLLLCSHVDHHQFLPYTFPCMVLRCWRKSNKLVIQYVCNRKWGHLVHKQGWLFLFRHWTFYFLVTQVTIIQ